MQLADMIAYLGQTGDALKSLGFGSKQIKILVVGGAALMAHKLRPSTDDVDIVIIAPHHKVNVMRAARGVASKEDLPATWLNDVISEFLVDQGTVPLGTRWKAFGALEVRIAPLDYLLATKILANRDKDVADIRVLMQKCRISTQVQAQALIDRYFPDKKLQELEEVPSTLEMYFS